MSFSRGSSPPRDQTCVSYVSCAGEFFCTNAIWEAQILVESELHRARSRGAGSQGAGVVLQSAVRVEAVLEHRQCHASWPGRWDRQRQGIPGRGEGPSKGSKEWKAKPEEPLFSSMSPLFPEARISSQAVSSAPTHSLS